jgi:hypothetical protein
MAGAADISVGLETTMSATEPAERALLVVVQMALPEFDLTKLANPVTAT